MIPDNVLEVLKNGIGHIGTVSDDLKPFHADLLGIKSDKSSSVITCFLNKKLAENFLSHIQNDCRLSLFVGVISHEAYNLKGAFLKFKDITDDDKEFCANFRENIYSLYDSMGIPKDLASKYWGHEIDIAMDFAVDTIFVQTPGPDAGNKLNI